MDLSSTIGPQQLRLPLTTFFSPLTESLQSMQYSFVGSVVLSLVLFVETSCPDGAVSILGAGLSTNCTCKPGAQPKIPTPSEYYDVAVSRGYLRDLDECLPCWAGKFKCCLGLETCQDCPSGSFASSGASACWSCPDGQVLALREVGVPLCQNCSAGYYSANTSVCSECPPGKYNPLPMQTTCTNCSAGLYSRFTAASSLTACHNCSAGTHGPEAGATACIDCAAGEYSTKSSMTACDGCPWGTFSTAHAASSQQVCRDCTPARYASYNASSTCMFCVAGSFSQHAAKECTKCQAGKYLNTTGVELERILYEAIASSNVSQVCKNCTAGTWAAAGAPICTQCLPGTFSTAVGIEAFDISVCSTCFAGTISGYAATTCADCQEGTYALAGSSVCDLCPTGKKSSERGNTATGPWVVYTHPHSRAPIEKDVEKRMD